MIKNIIYVSNSSSKNMYSKLLEQSLKMNGIQAQKFHNTLELGFVFNGINVTHISGRYVNRSHKKIYFKKCSDFQDGVRYIYLPFINWPIIRSVMLFWFGIMEFIRLSKVYSNRDTAIIFDPLNYHLSSGILSVAKRKKYLTVGVITDIPNHLYNSVSLFGQILSNMWISKTNLLIAKFDRYVFLAPKMGELINMHGKMSIIVEGLVNSHNTISHIKTMSDNIYACVYAGILDVKYGLRELIYGFLDANINGLELHLFGDGNMRNEIEHLCNSHANIKYFGVKPNDFVVEYESKVQLLVNPRPIHESYSVYSFPSKIMEYMNSGTPVLTTRLVSIPEEYYQYLLFVEGDSRTDFSKAFHQFSKMSKEELYQFGIKAREFVKNNKSNSIQARKILDLLNSGYDYASKTA